MMKRFELMFMVLQVPMDFLMLLLAASLAYAFRFTRWAVSLKPVLFHLSFPGYIRIVLPVILLWLVLFALSGLYSRDPNRKLMRDLQRVVFACSAGLSVIALYFLFRQTIFDSRFLVAVGWALAIVCVSAGRIIMRGIKILLYRAGIGARRVAIVGHHGVAEEIIKTLRVRLDLGYTVVGQFVHVDDMMIQSLAALRPDEVIFTNPRAHEDETLRVLEFCHEQHITFKYSADLFDTFSTNMTVHPLAGVPIIELRRTPLEGWGRVVKRLFDIVVSFIMIVLLSPLLIVIAVVIVFETGFPIIYRNERVGARGERFCLWKFRSMYQKDCTGWQFGQGGKEAEAREAELIATQNSKTGPIYKIANDPRVTPFGRWLRRYSLDELPQFFNVLIGAMSIVGPRPHQPREVAQYGARHWELFTLKPGVTGLAQISGRSDLSFDEEVRLDVFYIEHWRLWLDVVIFLKTPFILFKKRKAL